MNVTHYSKYQVDLSNMKMSIMTNTGISCVQRQVHGCDSKTMRQSRGLYVLCIANAQIISLTYATIINDIIHL